MGAPHVIEQPNQPRVVRLFGVHHDEYSTSRVAEALDDHLSAETDAIFFELPADDDLNPGEGFPEEGFHVGSFFWRPFLRHPAMVLLLVLLTTPRRLIREMVREKSLPSWRVWTWPVGRKTASEWSAATRIAEDREIPLYKVDKPMYEVIENQGWNWAIMSWLIVGAIGYGGWRFAEFLVRYPQTLLATYFVGLLAFYGIARLQGRTVQWRTVGKVAAGYLVLVVGAGSLLANGWTTTHLLITAVVSSVALYLPLSIIYRALVYDPFIPMTIPERNAYMMEHVVDRAEREGFEDVAVIVGRNHLANFQTLCRIRGIESTPVVDMDTWE
jgi:hypothetical protein